MSTEKAKPENSRQRILASAEGAILASAEGARC
jgi:hypothetical protein